jgi:4-amino-4-deoxychorismate lyase
MNVVETIRIENRTLDAIRYHNDRFNRTRKELFGVNEKLDLTDVIAIPDNIGDGVYKCRVIYNESVQRIEFAAYSPRTVNSLKLIHADTIDYSSKYEDRAGLLSLLSGIPEDDVIIIKNGNVTDASYANLAFFDGDQWFTPDTFLLRGTRREQLLEEGIIRSARITVEDIAKFHSCRLINSMMLWQESPVVPIGSIYL